ncbi:helix-turn-helix transcriptional regulator [Streptomyces sp. NPDC021212]|uniref:helix-turn-helix transcriptional regulator n=1 Tax=Streptomyces sp. NPDC021212 TaxID=3365118 RepID=UPI0037978997
MGDEPHNAARPDSEGLSYLLRHWRERLDPTRIRGIDSSRRRLKPGLTQQEVAQLTNVSLAWYRELERGKHRRFDEQFLRRLAQVLRLDEAERAVLFRLAAGYAPLPGNSSSGAAMDQSMHVVLDQMAPHPAYVSNLWWDIVAHNQPVGDWFPQVLEQPNLMRFVFLHPEARRQLLNWRRDWAAPSLAQIRYASAIHPDCEELVQLRDDILMGNAEAREMWRANQTRAHSDGDRRFLRLPYHGGQEVCVRITAFAPLINQDLRFVILLRL